MKTTNDPKTELSLVVEMGFENNTLVATGLVNFSITDYYPASRGEKLDFGLLEYSMLEEGDYFLFTCDCGAAGCAGRFKGIRVTFHKKDTITWEDLDKDITWVLSRKLLEDQIQVIRSESEQFKTRLKKQHIYYKEKFGAWN